MKPGDEPDAARKSELIPLMKQSLEGRGFKVEVPGVAKGVSRAMHSFDLIATKDDKRFPIDVRIVSPGEVELGDVLETYAKSLDTKLKPAVVVAMNGASSEARKSAKTFGLLLIEGASVLEILDRLNDSLGS
jgi:predicted RecB family endonuclease